MRRAALVVAAAALLAAATQASAEPRSTTRDGMTLTASKAAGLAVDGETVRVSGTGYDRSKGIYVAFCVDNGPGNVPTPCGGGADTEGSSGGSVWISDFPPAYGTGLARAYGDGGSFAVDVVVRAQLDEETDCRVVRCAVVTRNDHTRSEDRSQDVVVPVSFGTTASGTPAPLPPRTATPVTRPRVGGGASAQPVAPGAAAATVAATATPSAALPTPASSSAGAAAAEAAGGEPAAVTTAADASSTAGRSVPATLVALAAVVSAGLAVRRARSRRG